MPDGLEPEPTTMHNQDTRLMRCFLSVFRDLGPEEVRSVSVQSTGVWDSLTGVTLATVVQEEFGIEIELTILPQLDSFAAFQQYLARLEEGG